MSADLRDALALARAGDERGFSTIYTELAASVNRYAHSRNVEDPEQFTNDVFLSAFRSLDRFEGDEDRLRGWIFTIARNRAIDDARRRSRRPTIADADVPEETNPGADVVALRGLEADHVTDHLAVLTDEQREVLMLRLVTGLTIAEVAETVGREIGAVKALQRRAIRRLQKELPDDPYPSDHHER